MLRKYVVAKLFKDGVLHSPGIVEIEDGQPIPQGAHLLVENEPAEPEYVEPPFTPPLWPETPPLSPKAIKE